YDATSRPAAVHHKPLLLRPSHTVHQQQSPVLHHLRKLLPSLLRRRMIRYLIVSTVNLNIPPGPRYIVPLSKPPLLGAEHNSGAIRTGSRRERHAPLRITDVPLAQGQIRNATVGAPIKDDSCVHDEEFDSPPPSPHLNSQQASGLLLAPTNSREHGSGRSCFCF
ncbi:hypothetical protein K503DRAFT_787504, partial [Rhizopogon vinicolor AM-OR11-026]